MEKKTSPTVSFKAQSISPNFIDTINRNKKMKNEKKMNEELEEQKF